MKKVSLAETFARTTGKALLIDGAVGSILASLQIPENKVLWAASLLFTHPYEVFKLHRQYVLAGADVITTNTFRTNPVAVIRSGVGHQFTHLVGQAVELAKEAVQGSRCLIAGSNPPAEDSYQQTRSIHFNHLQSNHIAHIDALMEGGVDFILNETMSHLDEIRIVNAYCTTKEIPYVISLYCTEDGRILSGEKIDEIIDECRDYNPLAVGLNCIKPETFSKVMQSVRMPENWGFYLNCGLGNVTDCSIEEIISADSYKEFIERYLYLKPSFVGACCGSTPAHILAIRKMLDEKSYA